MRISVLFLSRVLFIYFYTLKAQRALHEKGGGEEREEILYNQRTEVVSGGYIVAGKSITNKLYLALRVIWMLWFFFEILACGVKISQKVVSLVIFFARFRFVGFFRKRLKQLSIVKDSFYVSRIFSLRLFWLARWTALYFVVACKIFGTVITSLWRSHIRCESAKHTFITCSYWRDDDVESAGG